VFLNEKSYGQRNEGADTTNLLCFLGYYALIESRYVVGDEHENINDTFSNPTDSEWTFLTFRLHPHLRIKAKPFIQSLSEVDRLLNDDNQIFKTIVLDHDDHGEIYYYCISNNTRQNVSNCYAYNHQIGINEVIDQLIMSGEIKNYVQSIDGNDESRNHSNMNAPSAKVNATHAESNHENGDFDHDSQSEYETDTDKESEDEYTPSDTSDEETSNEEPEDKCTPSDTISYQGTGATIPEIVNCCVYNNAAVAMRYNKRSLRDIDGLICASPLSESSLGVTLRTLPTPSSNRSLDVNLCYLRHTFKEHPILLPSISANKRIADVPIEEVLEEMFFQIIIFRYTGRVYRYEQYRKYYSKFYGNKESERRPCFGGIPRRCEHQFFLKYVELDLVANNATTLTRWVSKQHDGSISYDLRQKYHKFDRFVRYVAGNISSTVFSMMSEIAHANSDNGMRSSCVQAIGEFLHDAMEHGSVRNFGRINWMAHSIISDLEEFVVDPFGNVSGCLIPPGNYSQLGYEMVNRAAREKMLFMDTIQAINTHIHHNTPEECLNVLGLKKLGGDVVNIVNERPFSDVDAEHYLCKAWLIAKLTFGHNRIAKYPKQCNNHTHPSPVIHRLSVNAIDECMKTIEDAYMNLISNHIQKITLPDFCILAGENFN
jgi:hypothetical protein